MSPSMDKPDSNHYEKHAALTESLSEFDLVDIGDRVPEIAEDLKNVKNILVTGGAGFM